MSFQFGQTSLRNLQHVHPDLKKVFIGAILISEVDFGVSYPVRTFEKQKLMIDTGASKTMNSRHILRLQDTLGVHAGDVFAWVDNRVSWEFGYYQKIAKAMFRTSIKEGVQIEWGGHWVSPLDGPHWQLSWKDYP